MSMNSYGRAGGQAGSQAGNETRLRAAKSRMWQTVILLSSYQCFNDSFRENCPLRENPRKRALSLFG